MDCPKNGKRLVVPFLFEWETLKLVSPDVFELLHVGQHLNVPVSRIIETGRDGVPTIIIWSVSTWHIEISGWIYLFFSIIFFIVFGFQIFGLFYGFLRAVHDVDAFGKAFESLT